MFDSFRKHTPERLEELLNEYSESTNFGAARRVLKCNMYLGEDVELLAFASNVLCGVNDEKAQFYARKSIPLFEEGNIPTLWILPELNQLPETDLEKIIPVLDEILPNVKQYAGIRSPNAQEKKYIKEMLEDSLSRAFIPHVLGKIRRRKAKLEFVENNEYQGKNVNILVGFSNIYHSSYGFEFDLCCKEFDFDTSESEWHKDRDKLKRVEALGDKLKEYQRELKQIGTLEDKAIAYADKIISPNLKDYSLLRKLDCVFSTTESNPTSIYRNKVEELLDSPEEVFKVLDFVFKYRNSEYYEEHRWALDKFLEKDSDNLDYLRRAAKLEFGCFQSGISPGFTNHRENARKFHEKIYEQTQDTSEVPEEFWQDFSFGRWARSEQETPYQDWGYDNYEGFSNQEGDNRTYNWQEPFSGSRNERQRESAHARTNSFNVAFTILDISSAATFEEAHLAYKVQALKFHPDRNPGNGEAERKIREINVAWGDLKTNFYRK